jgi:hypothetical protein
MNWQCNSHWKLDVGRWKSKIQNVPQNTKIQSKTLQKGLTWLQNLIYLDPTFLGY